MQLTHGGGNAGARIMQPLRKPVNVFAIRCRERAHANAMRPNAMYGTEGMDGVKEGMEGTVKTDELEGIKNGVNGLEGTDARKALQPPLLARPADESSGTRVERAHKHAEHQNEVCDSGDRTLAQTPLTREHQSVSLKPDGGAQGGAGSEFRPIRHYLPSQRRQQYPSLGPG
jgi:hypothetical protein